MTALQSKRARPGVVLVRIAACVLLAASFAMLFLPWISLDFEENSQRYTLRGLADRASSRGVPKLPASLTQQERSLYDQLLPKLDPLLDDRLSPLNIALCCVRSADVLSKQLSYQTTENAWSRSVETTASHLRLTGIFLLVLLGFLLLSCLWAIASAAVGYGFGVMPYLFGALPAVFGLVLSSSRANTVYQGSSSAARALRSAVDSFRLSGNPASEPFRVTANGILFPVLLACGVLLTFCVLSPRRREEPQPETGVDADSMIPGDSPNVWRCPQCGTLMGDGVYCVSCGARRLEPHLCAFCGARLEDRAEFCSFCGTPVPRQGVPARKNRPFGAAASPDSKRVQWPGKKSDPRGRR